MSAVAGSRLFSSGGALLAAEVSDADCDLEAVIARLAGSHSYGVLRIANQEPGPTRFRVGAVGGWRWPLRDQIQARLGWVNDPRRWDVNLEVADGVLIAEVGFLHYSRRIRHLARQDVSTTPVIAAVLCRLAKLRRSDRVFDPFCGSGTILFDASFTSDGPLIGSDLSRHALAITAENLSDHDRALLVADAARSPLRSSSIDRIISNLPFGKQLGSHANNEQLYPAFLDQVEDLLVPDGRVVLLTEDKRLLRGAVERSGLTILRERVLETGGARPSAFVLGFKRSRRPRVSRSKAARPR